MHAYEGDTLVYTARCATGAAFAVEGVDFVDFITPIGEHTAVHKRPSRHTHGLQVARMNTIFPSCRSARISLNLG